MEKQFRFQDLEIWQKAAAFSGAVFATADALDEKRKFRFAEQLRAAALSITTLPKDPERFESGFRQFSQYRAKICF
jgi:hypothetical protein